MKAAILNVIVLAGILASACARPAAQAAQATCGGLPSDSARAVCRALDTLSRGYQIPSRVLSVERRADSFQVRTAPADAAMLDGMGLVAVGPGGLVLSVVVSDSL